MNFESRNIHWKRVFGAGTLVMVLSMLVFFFTIAGYAVYLSASGRRLEEKGSFSLFVANASMLLIPWLERVFTVLLAYLVARKAERELTAHGFFVGVVAGLLGASISVFFTVRLGLNHFIFFLILAELGWVGGYLAKRQRRNAAAGAPRL
jgi:uncharacterized membrane protein